MPRGFLVKRSRRPSPLSYRTHRRCCCFPEESQAQEAPKLFPPPILPPPPPPPPPLSLAPDLHFGTPEQVPLLRRKPTEEEEEDQEEEEEEEQEGSLRLSSPGPLLLGPGGEIKLWAVGPGPTPVPVPPPPRIQGSSKRPPGRKGKTARRLHFEDEVTTSPVLGLRIKAPPEHPPHPSPHPAPHPSPLLGEFICQLCKERYPDPLGLAQHKCSRIVRVEYRCPECDKLFSCPANLASHRRWHKPRNNPATTTTTTTAKAAAKVEPPPPPPKGKDSPGPKSGEEEEEEEKDQPLPAALRAGHSEEEEEEEGPPECPHRCPVCGEAFPTKSGQERHLRLLHSSASAAQAFPCKYCPASFYSSPGLTRHINKCHPSENRQVILLQVPLRPAC